jgi:hypothetical protein
MTATTSPSTAYTLTRSSSLPPQPALLGGREQPPRLDLAGEEAGVDAARLQGRRLEGGAEGLRGHEHPLGVDVEPAVHGLPDEVAAHEQEQHRGSGGHQEEDEQELHAQPCPEDAAPPLHEHADEVAAQHEDQDEEQGDVDDGEPEEQRRGGEVGLEVAALPQEQLGQEEDEEQPAGDGQDELRSVLEALPRHRGLV